jgi:pyruvate/2-oxoglutarate dehydrogenase complex dihydrolipoamide acyltransferase (E2) component
LVVGGISRRPRAIGDHIDIRDVLDLTLTIDYNVVDGGPATRFAADLRRLLHTAAALPPQAEPSQDETGN